MKYGVRQIKQIIEIMTNNEDGYLSIFNIYPCFYFENSSHNTMDNENKYFSQMHLMLKIYANFQ